MSDKQQHIILRFAMVFGIIAIGFLAVVGKIFLIQTKERSKWLSIADKQVQTNLPVRATRGNILDRDGRILSASMPQYIIYFDGGVEPLHAGGDTLFHRHVGPMSESLSRIIGDKSAAEYKAMLERGHRGYRNANGRLTHNIRLSTSRINYLQRKEIASLPLVRRGANRSGIYFEDKKRRIKPFGMQAARTIGNVNMETGRGTNGLEARYDEYLRGKDGLSTQQRVGGRWENITVREEEDGMDIRTTLDANLQDITETTLRAHVERCQATWGCALLMETESGKIRAIANLDRASDGSYYEGDNHAVRRVEPGSTFKTIALMAALEDKKIGINDTIEIYKKGWSYFNSHHYDAHPKDTVLTVRSALAISSNVALAKIITQAYDGSAKKFIKSLNNIIPGDTLLADLYQAQKAKIEIPNDTVTISKMSYGYSVEMTPLQILTFYNAIANNGHLVKPILVSDILSDGKSIKHADTELIKNQICSHKTLTAIRSALHDVVWDDQLPGTAAKNKWGSRKAQSDVVSIAGKTGTAQLWIHDAAHPHGHYSGRDHRMTFVGYFPEENPKFTCLVMIHHPKNRGLYDAGLDCGTAVREIAEQSMAISTYYTVDKNGEKVLHTR